MNATTRKLENVEKIAGTCTLRMLRSPSIRHGHAVYGVVDLDGLIER